MDDILKTGTRHVDEMRLINRDLTEKALRMRCITYLSRVKEQLLLETIYEIDTGKKNIEKMARNIEEQRDTIRKQNSELEKKNRELTTFQKELEYRVTERTVELEQINEELQQEIYERRRAEEEKRKMQEQLLQSQKMESVGRLAGGVAHDFNNLLTAILGYCQLAMNKVPGSCPLRKELDIIFDAGEKGASLVRQLLAFSRKQVLEIKVVNLNDVVKNISKILSRMLGEHLEMTVHTEASWANILADVSQVEQVLVNLAVNARDAMPTGGRLSIETADVELNEEYVKYHEGLKPGPYVMLAVIDTGHGMSGDIQKRIFDPFFTTKEEGKGTGLGLATVHGVVKQHKGHIVVKSEPGKGTTFRIYFKAAGEKKEKSEPREALSMPRGSETILVVDDDAEIRNVLADTLTPLGYRVLDAPNGEEALKISQSPKRKIDLLLSDIIMPGMNGKELKDEFKKKYPETKVIFMSGYLDTVVSKYVGPEPGYTFVQKPFSPSKLANKLRIVLDREPVGSKKQEDKK